MAIQCPLRESPLFTVESPVGCCSQPTGLFLLVIESSIAAKLLFSATADFVILPARFSARARSQGCDDGSLLNSHSPPRLPRRVCRAHTRAVRRMQSPGPAVR